MFLVEELLLLLEQLCVVSLEHLYLMPLHRNLFLDHGVLIWRYNEHGCITRAGDTFMYLSGIYLG